MVSGPTWSQQWWCRVVLNVPSLQLSIYIASFCSSGVYDTDDIYLTMPWTTSILMFLQLRNFLSILWSPHLSVRSFCLQK